MRLASLMDIDTIYIWTHDSIGLGEDGPTHQPIEHLAALRAIPSLSVVRPGDPNETAYAWRSIIARGNGSGPVGFILTRQGIPVLEGTSAEGVAKGGYVLGGGNPADDADVLIIGTGSELQLAVEAQKLLADKDINAYVVSMPCVEWFEQQPQEYPRRGAAAGGVGAGRRRGGGRAELAQVGRRHRRDRLDRALRRVRRRQDTVPRVRIHRRSRGRRGGTRTG